MTISEQLIAVDNEKQAQRAALIAHGRDMTDVPFTQYHEEIAEISGDTTDPNLRPADWLKIPNVSINEIYLLLHLGPPSENYIAFIVNSIGGYIVEWGTNIDGIFTPSGSEIKGTGEKYEGTFNYDDWSNETNDGTRQVLLRITGADITIFQFSYHSQRGFGTYTAWNIVEFKGNLPNCTSCVMGGTAAYSAIASLRYFTLEGTNKITTGGAYMFSYCRALVSYVLDTSTFTAMSYIHRECISLMTARLNISKVTAAITPFLTCYNLTNLIFDGTRTTWPADVTLQYSAMTAIAVEAFFNSLPAITASRAITLTNTPAHQAFSGDESLKTRIIAIATAKGWTVTL